MGSPTRTKETKIRNKDITPLYSTTIEVKLAVLRLDRDGSVSMVGPADGARLSAVRKIRNYRYLRVDDRYQECRALAAVQSVNTNLKQVDERQSRNARLE
jgi:hypothetical protein